jgi:molybdopterin converting factor subunit 1
MVKVKLFAGFRELAKKSNFDISLGRDISLNEFISRLCDEIPALKKPLAERNAIIAVNHKVADEDTVIKNGDEVAIFPPVSGG